MKGSGSFHSYKLCLIEVNLEARHVSSCWTQVAPLLTVFEILCLSFGIALEDVEADAVFFC